MAYEIERKFVVKSDRWRTSARGPERLRQFYLAADGPANVRVRISTGEEAKFTVKSSEAGMRRTEFEYSIPREDAEAMLPLAVGSVIEKERYVVSFDGIDWEIDVFHGDNEGLVIAEAELASADQAISHPDWLGAEVTADARFYNAALAFMPFKRWP
ncbi:MAG: CYTH domain-containing protein [Hyphomicrobiaceae bacterium]